MDHETKKRWVKPVVVRSLTEQEIEDEMRGSDLRVHGMANFDIGAYSVADQPVPEG